MASKSFQVSIDFIGNISDLQSKIKQVTGEISKIGATSGGVQVQKQFEQLVKTVTDLQTRASQPIGSKAEFNKLAGEVSKANMTYGQLMSTIERLQSLGGGKLLEFLPKDQQNNIKQATQAVKEFIEAKEKAEKNQGKNAAYSKLAGEAKFAQQEVERLQKKLDEANTAKEKVFGSKASSGKTAKATREEYNQLYEQVRALERQRAELGTNKGLKEAVAAAPQGSEARAQAEAALAKYKELSNEISKINGQLNQSAGGQLIKNAEAAQKEYNKAAKEAAILSEQLKNTKIPEDGTEKLKAAFDQLVTKAAQLGVQVSDIGSVDNVQTLLNRLNQLESDGFIEGAQAAQQYANTIRSILDPAFKQMETGMNGVNQTWGQFITAQEDMSMLQNRLKYFFSLTNSIQLLKRTITSAMNTVKELDAVMTETAVVTDFTVGDMWDKLPEYANQASALGASIKDLYAATTLYYQQGLNSEQAMGIGIETMKMARIAGMDAAEATKAMTAALRGFNMEINETSATRINDVYSKLAAITAADTEQIATAMSKTASIADSANMEFETTAALLAQIIETTQEAPETAGTAMKTIIARFTEVKKLFNEGMLSGEDAEGEVIEINKIDAALRTVGISLTDFLNGQKGIDDIFLELASKWDTLDLATQRYIATTAAGSRQQSRFIAMMSNYDRTMELVTAANNSAGASQEQFDKTLDSMEAKLQKLKNAWNEFTMGLANNEILKGGIDLLTKLLQTINQLTSSLSGGGGLIKSFLNLAVVGGALGVGKKLLGNFFGFAGNAMGIPQTFAAASGQSTQNTQGTNPAASLFRNPLMFNPMAATTMMYAPTAMLGSGLGGFVNKTLTKKYEGLSSKRKDIIKGMANNRSSAVSKIKDVRAINGRIAQHRQLLNPTEEQKAASYQKGHMASGIVTGVGILASSLSTVARNNGNEKLANGLQAVGTTGIIAGQGIGIMNQALAMAGTTWGAFGSALVGILPVLGPVAAGVAAIGAAAFALYKMSPEGKLKDAEKYTKQISKGAQQAAESYDKLTSSVQSISDQEKALEDMTYGTDEWRKASTQLNQDVLDLIETYPKLADEVTMDEDGVLRISKEGMEAFLKEEKKDVSRAESAKLGAELNQEKLRKDTIDSSDFMGAFQGAMKTITYDDGTQTQVRDEAANRELADLIASGQLKTAKEVQEYANNNQEWLEQGISINVTDQIFSDLKDYGYARQAQDMVIEEKERQIAENIKSMSEIYGYADEMSKDLDNDFVMAAREKAFQEARKDYNVLDDTELKRYADMMGYKSYTGKGLFNATFLDSEGKTIKINKNAIREALASADADKSAAETIGKIDEVFSNDAVGKEIAKQVLSSDGKNVSAATVKKFEGLFGEYGKIEKFGKDEVKNINEIETGGNIEKMIEALGWDADKFKELAKTTGMSLGELYNAIAENIESGNDRIADQRKNLVQNMNKYTKEIEGITKSDFNAQLLAQLETGYGEDFRNMLEGVFSSLSMSGDSSIIAAGYGNFISKAFGGLGENGIVSETAKKEVKELAEFIQGIDWSNPIEGASRLKQEIKSGSEITKQFAKNMLTNSDHFFGLGSQMRYFLNSEEFSGVREEITEILKTSENITTANVLELADSYNSLNKILENTGATAAGVAKALQAVAEGDLFVNQLTDAVMASLASFGSLESMIAGLKKTIESFDAGIDEGFSVEFLGQAFKVIKGHLDKGAIGNSQISGYYDFIFGEGWDADVRNDKNGYAQLVQQNALFLERNSENMKDFWINAATGKDIYGNYVDGNRSFKGFEITLDNGEVKINNTAGLTTDEMATEMADVLGISKELAQMALTDFKNNSWDFAYNQNKIDSSPENIAKSIWENGNVQEGGTLYYDKADLLTIGKLYNLTEDELNRVVTSLEQIAKDSKGKAVQTDFYNEDGSLKTGKELISAMAKARGYGEVAYDRYFLRSSKLAYDENGKPYTDYSTYNLDKINKEAASLGLPEGTGTQIMQDIVDGLKEGEEIEMDFVASDGSLQTIGLKAGDNVEQAIANREIEIKNEALANSIVKAFQNTEISVIIKVDEKALENVPGTASLTPFLTTTDFSGTITLTPSLGGGKDPENPGAPSTMGSTASGIKNSPSTYDSLVGEEGPELIWRKNGTAYLSGVNGPEITTVKKGETVYTAEETKNIFNKNKGYQLSSFDGGTPRSTTSSGYGSTTVGGNKGSGGSSSNDKKKGWENPYDELYNLSEKINQTIREREKLERRYDRLIDRRIATAAKLHNNSQAEIESLREQAKLQQQMIEGRQRMMQEQMEENAELQKYATIDVNSGQIIIDWDLIDSVTDDKEGEKIEEYVSKLEELRDSMHEAEDAIEEIDDSIWEIEDRGREEYLDLEDRIKEAIIENRKEEVDALEEINNSINSTNIKLIDSIQKSVDKMRQDRENEKTEEDLGEKQRRLAYLEQDTSGANAMEILELRKEIEEAQEDYTDTLIDQKISELQEQNDKAAEQREQQITLMQNQLDWYVESGRIWAEVNDLLKDGLDSQGGLIRGSMLEDILKKGENWKGLSEIGQMEWLLDLETLVAQSMNWQMTKGQLENLHEKKTDQEITFKNAKGETLTGKVDDKGQVWTDDETYYKNVYQWIDGTYHTTEETASKYVKPKPITSSGNSSSSSGGGSNKKSGGKQYPYHVPGIPGAYTTAEEAADAAVEYAKQTGKEVNSAVMNYVTNKSKGTVAADSSGGTYTYEGEIKKYATGGLADFTGPAWLDGTKSRPELVLNQRDTQNFIQLKDILSSIMSRNLSNTFTATENNGDITYDIDINVETMGSDYDVEQVASKVKSMINEDARYRNNNAISLKR